MKKCLKMLALFNKRAKLLFLKGHTKFQILSELKLFLDLIDEDSLTKIDFDNNIFNNEDKDFNINRKIDFHSCENLFFNEDFDSKFIDINDTCKNVDFNDLEELSLIDEFLDNQRIAEINDITLSTALSIYGKLSNNKTLTKENYLNSINTMLEDVVNKITSTKQSILFTCETAFVNLDYSISNVSDRIEIYQDVIILICKLSELYNFETEVLIEYLDLYLSKLAKDILYLNDMDNFFEVTKVIYTNIEFNEFYIFLPFFLEYFSPSYIQSLLKNMEEDLFFKKDENFQIMKIFLLFNSADFFTYHKFLSEDTSLSEFEYNLSLLEFAINYSSKEYIEFYWSKIRYNQQNVIGNNEIIADITDIVDNFDRIITLTNHLKNINKDNISKRLVEIEKVNFLSRSAYSCALNRIFYYYFDLNSFNFYFLLILLNLGLYDKASIYFYHNINYIEWENVDLEEIFMNSNLLFLINCFDFASEFLFRLYKHLKHDKNSKNSPLLKYVLLELSILQNLMIPLINDTSWDNVIDS